MKVENSPEIQSDAQEDKRRYESKAGEHLFVDWLEEETLNLEARRESASRHDDEVFASMRGVRSVYRKVVFLVALLVPLVLLGLLFALIHCDRLSRVGRMGASRSGFRDIFLFHRHLRVLAGRRFLARASVE